MDSIRVDNTGKVIYQLQIGMGEASAAKNEVEALRGRLSRYMEREGLRSTAQRRLVADIFFDSGGHLSIEELLALVRERDAKVGYATVYRTLKLLTDSGVANARHFGDGVSRYEVAFENRHHDHLICVDCGKIIEFENEQIEKLQDEVAKGHGFEVKRHKLELYGKCVRPDCPNRPPE